MTIVPETGLERLITADPEWKAGVAWDEPRPGHPEATVAAHIGDVPSNIEQVALGPDDRGRLRFVALVHNPFKHRVDQSRPRVGVLYDDLQASCRSADDRARTLASLNGRCRGL